VCVCVWGGYVIKSDTKSRSTLVTLPRNVTPYRDSVNGARDRLTFQKLVTRSRYGLVRRAVGIWLSLQRDDTVTAGASVDVQRHAARPHLLSRYGVTLRGNVTSADPPLKLRFNLRYRNALKFVIFYKEKTCEKWTAHVTGMEIIILRLLIRIWSEAQGFVQM